VGLKNGPTYFSKLKTKVLKCCVEQKNDTNLGMPYFQVHQYIICFQKSLPVQAFFVETS
jgi:hypothetical protein